jgi:hypothetical protein
MSNEEMIANKVEMAIVRGTSPKYPLAITGPATKTGILTVGFEGRTYRVTIEDLGEIPEEDED